MTEKATKMEKLSNIGGKPVPMKLFAAWEVDRTPPNCVPRLCSLTITRLSLLTPLPADMTSLTLAVKMQSSKRTLRSHEIPVPQSISNQNTPLQQQQSLTTQSSFTSTTGISSNQGNVTGTISLSGSGITSGGGSHGNSISLLETDLDLHFSLQYPHFIKRDGNRLVLLLQRRKKYKTRTILGYKTLAEGIIRMDAVLQKSMDMTIDLTATGKGGGQAGTTIATVRAERVSSIPVDQDNKNNNSVLLTDRVNEYSDEDEEGDFSSGEDNDDGTEIGIPPYGGKREYLTKQEMRKYRKLARSENDGETEDAVGQNPVDSDSEFEMKDKGPRAKLSRQRNFKQKIVALLKRFKVSEELDGAVTRGAGALRGERDLDALFQELESLSCGEGDDSGPDMDSISVGSTPKPSLRPFFTNSRITLHDNASGDPGTRRPSDKSETANDKKIITTPDRGPDLRNDSSGNEANAGNTDPEGQNSDPQNTGSPPREKDSINNSTPITTTTTNEKRSRLFRTSSSTPSGKKKQSLSLTTEPKSVLETCLSPTNVEPRKTLLEQLSKVFTTEEAVLPDVVTLISPPEPPPRLNTILSTSFRHTFSPQNTAEVKAILQALMTKIQKYCNSTAKPPTTVKVLLLGGDWLQGSVLRHYVDLLGVRPPDWVNHIRFYIVPFGASSIARYLSAIDPSYSSMFGTENWFQLCEHATNPDATLAKSDILELTNRIQRYLHTVGPCTQIPIAEAMVNYKDEDSCQIFVPFVSDVRIGFPEGPQLSLDLDESSSNLAQQANVGAILSSSPPLSGRNSPPLPATPAQNQNQESVELQIDYWPLAKQIDPKDKSLSKSADQGKNSIKSTFRSLHVWRLSSNPLSGDASNGLTVNFATKEKKQKIMRLGKKKEKDRDLEKEQCVEGVARLICSPKQSHPVPLRGCTKCDSKSKLHNTIQTHLKESMAGYLQMQKSGICHKSTKLKPLSAKVFIDGTEWTGVKFFQLSSQWQTHVKNFPVALVGAQLSCADIS